MQRISWTAHITNETVLKQTCQVRQLLNTIKNTQLQFFGHIMRQENLEQISITGRINGKRARGRQRYNYLDQLKIYSDPSLYRASPIAASLLRGIFYSAFFTVNPNWLRGFTVV